MTNFERNDDDIPSLRELLGSAADEILGPPETPTATNEVTGKPLIPTHPAVDRTQ